VLEESLRHNGLKVERRQAQAGFARLAVSDGAEVTEVDLCYDVRLRPPEATPLGPVLAAEELAADKMLAFYSRALPRDLVDVHALARRYGFDRLCELAAEKDRGSTCLPSPTRSVPLGEYRSKPLRLPIAEWPVRSWLGQCESGLGFSGRKAADRAVRGARHRRLRARRARADLSASLRKYAFFAASARR
jgi:Uncharacterized conserved protein